MAQMDDGTAKERALDRLRARCSAAEVSSGMALEMLRRWSTPRAGGRTATSKSGTASRTASLSERDMAQIITTLIEERFIDDGRFANAFVRDKLKFNGWGRQKIVFKLRSLGVDAQIIDQALKANYYCEAEGDAGSEAEGCPDRESGTNLSGQSVLEKLVDKKWDSLKGDEPLQSKKAKVVRFAASRGFDYGDIMAALRKKLSNLAPDLD